MALFKKKNVPEIHEPMDLDAVMKKYDRESNTRIWEGKPKMIIGPHPPSHMPYMMETKRLI